MGEELTEREQKKSDKRNNKKPAKTKKQRTYIGGQAVLEGVMMLGKTAQATAVRDPDGVVQIESQRLNRGKKLKTALKIPFVRGVINLVLSLINGTRTLMRSAAVYGEDEEDAGRIEKWFAEKLKISIMDVITTVSAIVGVVLAVGIFVFLPQYLCSLIVNRTSLQQDSVWFFVIMSVFKFAIFLIYLGLVLLLKDIRRLYMYHGAEHKTINAYEYGLELTVENVKSCSRIHDRCGTSFLFIVLLINVVCIGVVTWASGVQVIENVVARFFARVGIEVALLPVIAGFSYEILKFLAKFDNKFVAVLKSPGTLLQKVFTTREPDDSQIEVAIAAFNKVLEMDADETVPETKFVTGGLLSKKLKETKEAFKENGIDESDAEWIYSIVLDVKRSDLNAERVLKPSECKKCDSIISQRLTGRPLWYIIGDTEFCGCKIKVDERALIPRPETEILAEHAIKTVEEGDKVLDMCTGSGCIAVAIATACRDKNVSVTAADVSDAAIMLARENANYNSANITFVQSDLFSNVHGRFNLIVCNPPYVRSGEIPSLQREVREFEPRVALDGGDDGLDFYRRLAKEVTRYLARDGMLMLECGEGQTGEILKLFEKREYAIVVKDLAGVDRFLKIAF